MLNFGILSLMKKLKILVAPHPLLREKAKEVGRVDESLKAVIAQMFKIMKASKGVGLAAPQLAISKRFFVMGGGEDEEKVPFQTWVNPFIKPLTRKKVMGVEGCLSFPGLELPILRFAKIKVRGKDEENRPKEVIYEGYAARVIQHEFDHLEGVLFTDRLKPLKLVLMGSPEFSAAVFEAIYAHPAFEIVLVVSESDKPKGRGLKIQPTPVSQWAERRGLPLYKVAKEDKSLSKLEQKLKKLHPDLLLVCAFNRILPPAILNIPKYPALNLHYSLLPKYRGASPVQAALLAGDAYTGISLMQMDEHLDTGPIVYQEKVEILPSDNSESLTWELTQKSSQILPSLLVYFVGGLLKAEPQKGSASYAPRLKKEDGKIDWQKSPAEIERFIRAMAPWPGAYTEVAGQTIKILKSHLEGEKLLIDMLQLPGKKPISAEGFKRNYKSLALTLPL